MISKFFEGISWSNVALGLQHLFVAFGATVLVPLLTGLNVGVALFAAGVGTLIFHFSTKMEMPVFLGSSFAFIPAIAAIAASAGGLPAALGGIAVSGLLYVVVSLIFRKVDVKWLHKILPARVTGPIIVLIGLMLAPVAISNAAGAWWIAVLTLAVGIFVKIFFKSKLSAFPVIVAVAAGFIVAALTGYVDFTAVAEAAWIGLPAFTLPAFNWKAISIAVPIAIVTMIEHFGDVLAIGNVVEKDFIAKPGISRTLLGDGIATTISALIGGPANTTYSENTGAVALTGVRAPVVMRIAALFAILIAFIPKFTAIISVIPAPVIGGISILLFGMIASIGIKNMVDAKVNFSDSKNLIIVSTMLVLGLGGATLTIGALSVSSLALAAIVGIVLNIVLNFKELRE